jgi:hypothetical protein
MKEILNIIHKTIYQFFDVCEDDAPMSDKDKLLLEVNKAICNNLKAFNVPDINDGDLVSRQAVIDTIETDCSWDIFNEWGSRTPTGECIINAIKSVPSVETESCGDCISRQAVNKLVDELARAISDEKCHIQRGRNYGRIMHDILELPSVEPERKTGKWVHMVGWWECDQCHAEYTDMPTCMGKVIYEYCPMCGAKMEVDG